MWTWPKVTEPPSSPSSVLGTALDPSLGSIGRRMLRKVVSQAVESMSRRSLTKQHSHGTLLHPTLCRKRPGTSYFVRASKGWLTECSKTEYWSPGKESYSSKMYRLMLLPFVCRPAHPAHRIKSLSSHVNRNLGEIQTVELTQGPGSRRDSAPPTPCGPSLGLDLLRRLPQLTLRFDSPQRQQRGLFKRSRNFPKTPIPQ